MTNAVQRILQPAVAMLVIGGCTGGTTGTPIMPGDARECLSLQQEPTGEEALELARSRATMITDLFARTYVFDGAWTGTAAGPAVLTLRVHEAPSLSSPLVCDELVAPVEVEIVEGGASLLAASTELRGVGVRARLNVSVDEQGRLSAPDASTTSLAAAALFYEENAELTVHGRGRTFVGTAPTR